MRRFWKNNSLSIVMVSLFFVFWIAQSLMGWFVHNDEQQEHGQQKDSYGKFLASGDFMEATFENWESEFLEMSAFVFLSAFLVQKGSSQSNKPGEEKENPEQEAKPSSPRPVLRGGLSLKVYSHSLTLTLFGLFLFCWSMHALGGMRQYNEQALMHGQATKTLLGFIATPKFWFQSFQNWQSEFLAIASIVLLSIVFREKDSAESKRVAASNAETEA